MTEQAIAARRQYKREWARANKDKVKAQQERHWERVAAAMQAMQNPAQPPQGQEDSKT